MKEVKLSTYQQLSEAVRHNDMKSVCRLLKSDSIDLSSIKEGSLLSKCNDSGIAAFLMYKGAKREAKDTQGRTPLARCRGIQEATVLVDVGANVNAECGNGETVLTRVASRKEVEVLCHLIKNGATRWGDSSLGNRFFKNAFENFKCLPVSADRETDTDRVEGILRRMESAKNKSRVVQGLLDRESKQDPFLQRILSSSAPVHHSERTVGDNVTWDILRGIHAARDKRTGQKLNISQILFPRPVIITLPDRDGNVKGMIKVSGTAQDVFRCIYDTYVMELYKTTCLFFEGLQKKREGQYYMEVKWEDGRRHQ